MNVSTTAIEGPLVLQLDRFHDARGSFQECWNEARYAEAGIPGPFVQDNESTSAKDVLRGLHYQWPRAQGKLVRVIRGRAFDVAVDLRRSSRTFGRWVGIELNEIDACQFWIPVGFAHGFLSLEPDTIVQYKTTGYYTPADEHTIRWDDADLAIDWPLGRGDLLISDKDRRGGDFKSAAHFE